MKKAGLRKINKNIRYTLDKLVEVTWADSSSRSGWDRAGVYADSAQPLECRTAGYLFRRTEYEICIVQNVTEHGHVDMMMTIPFTCVRSIRNLN